MGVGACIMGLLILIVIIIVVATAGSWKCTSIHCHIKPCAVETRSFLSRVRFLAL